MIELIFFLYYKGVDSFRLWVSGLKIRFSSSTVIDKTMGSKFLDSKEIRMEVLMSIDNFWMTMAICSSIIIGGGMGDTSLVRELDGGIEKGVDDFIS